MVTFALIGAGKWGQNYLHTINLIDNAEIKYICTQNQQSLSLFPNKYIKTVSMNNLLKNKDIDGFIIATPANTHFEIAKKILSLGKNLLIEKPLTTNYTQALELQRLWKAKKPVVLVGHTYLYNPAYQTLKRLLNNLRAIQTIHFEGLSSPIRKDVSVIWDWGPHPVSLILDLVEQPIVEVKATGFIKDPTNSLYDTIKAVLIFTKNIKASLHISWLGPKKIRKLTIKGDTETIELDETNITNQKISLYKPNTPPQHPQYRPESALTEELTEFIEAIQNTKQITSDINMGVNVIKVLSAIEQSVKKNGQPVLLK